MMTLAAALAGLAAGAVHVLAGPDHLAAVAPLAADGRRGAWRAGWRWGLGHAGGVLVVGLAALALRGVLPPERMAGWGERLVGVVLVGVGLWALWRGFVSRVHAHEHEHGETRHTHLHWHEEAPAKAHPLAHAHTHAAFAVGVLHGLAGGSHVLGVLPALALPSLSLAAAYLGAFGAGTVLAMGGFAAAIGLLGERAAGFAPALHRGLVSACGTAAILVGGYWLL